MLSEDGLRQSREAEAKWQEDFARIARRFGVNPDEHRRVTHSGIALKPVYFPHDLERDGLDGVGAPGGMARAPTPAHGISPQKRPCGDPGAFAAASAD